MFLWRLKFEFYVWILILLCLCHFFNIIRTENDIWQLDLPSYCCAPIYNITNTLVDTNISQPLCPRLCNLTEDCCQNTTVTSACAELAQRLFSVYNEEVNSTHPCKTYCGNGICDANETCESCLEDCGPCSKTSCYSPAEFLYPNDPLYPNQWHLTNTGQTQNGKTASDGNDTKVIPVWAKRYFGNGVKIAVIDDGVEWRSIDLFCSYDHSTSGDLVGDTISIIKNKLQSKTLTHTQLKHTSIASSKTSSKFLSQNEIIYSNELLSNNLKTQNNKIIDPEYGKGQNPVLWDNHGTSVAGLISGSFHNLKCGVGIAPKSKLSAVRLLGDNFNDWNAARALHWTDIDIYSNSWGPSDNGITMESYIISLSSIHDGILRGRNGLGSIYVWAGGNGRMNYDNSNYDALANSIYTIAVAASDWDGVFSNYSEPGSNILINAPSSTRSYINDSTVTYSTIFSTDRNGAAGYNYIGRDGEVSDTSCTGLFGGTSAACPIVSGVIALILEANPYLTWRDIQWILVQSATMNDKFQSEWELNGGGYYFNPNYGFGRINANKAVELAQKNDPICSIYISQTYKWLSKKDLIPTDKYNPLIYQYNSTSNIIVEHIVVRLDAIHPRRGAIIMMVESPSGVVSILAPGRPKDLKENFEDISFMSVQFWGEKSLGLWNIAIISVNHTGVVTNIQLEIYGSPMNCEEEKPIPPSPKPGPPPIIRWDKIKIVIIISTILFISVIISITIFVEVAKMQVIAVRNANVEIMKEFLEDQDDSESEFYATSSTSSLSTISDGV